jgi:hypothetical protein
MPLTALLIPFILGQSSVTLKYNPPIGVTNKYRMTMAMNQVVAKMPPMQMTFTIDLSMKALSQKGDVFTIETRTSDAKVDIPASSPMAAMKPMMEKQMVGKVVTGQFDSRNRPIGGSAGANVPGVSNMMQGLAFPDHAVKVGEKWTYNMDFSKLAATAPGAPAMSGMIPVNLSILSAKDGKATLGMAMKGTTTMPNPMGGATRGPAPKINVQMDTKGTIVIDIKTGTLVSMQANTDTITNLGGMAMTQHMTQTMTKM